jgi:hypothetical protein
MQCMFSHEQTHGGCNYPKCKTHYKCASDGMHIRIQYVRLVPTLRKMIDLVQTISYPLIMSTTSGAILSLLQRTAAPPFSGTGAERAAFSALALCQCNLRRSQPSDKTSRGGDRQRDRVMVRQLVNVLTRRCRPRRGCRDLGWIRSRGLKEGSGGLASKAVA